MLKQEQRGSIMQNNAKGKLNNVLTSLLRVLIRLQSTFPSAKK